MASIGAPTNSNGNRAIRNDGRALSRPTSRDWTGRCGSRRWDMEIARPGFARSSFGCPGIRRTCCRCWQTIHSLTSRRASFAPSFMTINSPISARDGRRAPGGEGTAGVSSVQFCQRIDRRARRRPQNRMKRVCERKISNLDRVTPSDGTGGWSAEPGGSMTRSGLGRGL